MFKRSMTAAVLWAGVVLSAQATVVVSRVAPVAASAPNVSIATTTTYAAAVPPRIPPRIPPVIPSSRRGWPSA